MKQAGVSAVRSNDQPASLDLRAEIDPLTRGQDDDVNVLMISDVYFPRINGVSTSIETFRRELSTLGVRSHLIAPAYPGEDADAGITRIKSKKVWLDPEDRMMRYGDIVKLAQSLRGRKFDLVHIHTPFIAHYAGLALARELRVPCVLTYHTLFEEYLHHYIPFMPIAWSRPLARRFSRAQCNAVDHVIVPSTAMLERLRAYGVKAPIEVLPTGIPLTQFTTRDASGFRSQYDIDAKRPVMLFVGRVAFEKNLAFLLRAVEIARRSQPQILLVIAGQGPAESRLKKMTRKLGLERNVRFIGYLDRVRELPACYCAANAFVFASDTETQGLVLLEAMAAGVPVISTAVMGTRDILAPARGALVAPQDEAGFAAAINRLLGDAALCARLAEEAPHYAREWASDVMARRLADFYRRAKVHHAAG